MKVLYATDGRPPAVAAGQMLARLVDPGVSVAVLYSDEYVNPTVADRAAEAVLGEAVPAIERAGFKVRRIRASGSPVRSIERRLVDDRYALVVVGAGNHIWLDRLIFGSVSSSLIHESEVPVLVVHQAPRPNRARVKVVVGADGSSSANRAIDTLCGMTTPERVEVHVRSVVELPNVSFPPHPAAYVPMSYMDDLLIEGQAAAEAHLKAALDRFHQRGFLASGLVVEGPPSVELLDAATDEEADLVVVGARGLGVLSRMALGSVSSHVARHAPATLVVRAPMDEGR
jgi:nucleotide-binding universal stress UspA family protein